MINKAKIILGLVVLVLVALLYFVGKGFYAMEIEDHYGDHQKFFYKSKPGDIAVNWERKEIKKVEKSWTRTFVTDERKRVDIWKWLNEDSVEVYRSRSLEFDKVPSYQSIEKLISEHQLELIVKNW